MNRDAAAGTDLYEFRWSRCTQHGDGSLTYVDAWWRWPAGERWSKKPRHSFMRVHTYGPVHYVFSGFKAA